MPIRYHAQRRHVIHSLETLLYQLHTLSFFLAPSLLPLIIRLATQHQFAGSRELEGRRPLGFWYALVALVNFGALWAHAASDAASRAAAGEKSVVLDFVGMRHVPTKLQLLFLDASIIFLQLILTTIAYENSIAKIMPEGTPDPLAFIDDDDCESGIPQSELRSANIRNASGSTSRPEEMEPFLPSGLTPPSSSTTSFIYPPPSSSSAIPSLRPSHHPRSASSSTPPTTSGSANSYQQTQNTKAKGHPPLPPRVPVLSLSLSHIFYRLIAPAPDFPTSSMPGLTAEDDELAALQLPLPNTAPVRMARTIMMLGRAARQQRQGNRQGQSGNGNGNGSGATNSSLGVRSASGEEESEDPSVSGFNSNTGGSLADGPVSSSNGRRGEGRQSNERSRRIPGAMEEEEDDE